MKKVSLILLTLAFPVLLLAAEPVREWKTKDGKPIIDASLDNLKSTDDPEHVYLLKEGKRYKVPFDKLSKADQDYVTRVRQAGRNINGGAGQNESRAMQVVPTSQRYALLIGVNAYPKEEKLKTLPSAVKDMTDLAVALEKFAGFPQKNIVLMTDNSPANLLPTRANIQEQIAKIRDRLTQNDLLIVAFSGHGVTIDYTDGRDARPYFCVRDTDLPDFDTLLSRNWVFEQIDKCKAERKIFFCDACRTLYTTDKIIQLASRAGQSASIRTLQDPAESWGYNYVLMSSCAKGQNSIDTGTNGLFISYLLEGLRTSAAASRDGDLTAFSWFEYAAKKTEIASERMIKENPALVIGAEKQKQQTPRIECRGEMSRFVIAKLDRAGLEVTLPHEVEDVKIREYQVGSLRVQLQTSGSDLSGEKIQAGKIQLPSIPKKIRVLSGETLGMKDALIRMQNGSHEAIREAEQAKTAAQAQYEAIKMRRDEAWKPLPPGVQNNLEERIKESPTSSPTSYSSLKPSNVSFSQFIKQVLWGQKTEQARLEKLRVEKALNVEIQKEINRIKAALVVKNKELDLEKRKFRQALVQYLLEQTPGWNKPNEDEKIDYLFLSETIPALLKYPFDWTEESLFSIAEALWKERRPCVIERIKREKQRAEKLEREKQERLERERAEKERQERIRQERLELERQERLAREEAERKRCEEEAKKLSIPGVRAGERKTVTVKGVEFAFRWCPPGTFMMGSPEYERGHISWELQHQVTLTKGFWMLETEITQKQWKAIMGNNPSHFKGDDNLPVEGVSWDDCQAFCKKCTSLGLSVQLPTEAQWEYACRAGSTTAYFWGNALNGDKANCNGTIPCGTTIRGSYLEKTTPVGYYEANAWGLYDMHGNVREWCLDWYDKNYPHRSVTDPVGPSNGSERVYRGGGWLSFPSGCRSADRFGSEPGAQCSDHGFRVIGGRPSGKIYVPVLAPSPVQTSSGVLKAGDRKVVTVNGVEFPFRYCPPGTFIMGTPPSEEGRYENENQHQVTLTKGFWMLETEVTQKQWKAIMGNLPNCGFIGDNLPVEMVSWLDSQEFCYKSGFKLPTEAQWEYACRANRSGTYAGNLDEMTWYKSNSGEKTHPVGMKKPNAWGLYDMLGNVRELCQDWFEDYPHKSVTDPNGPIKGFFRVTRGGCWSGDALFSRLGKRGLSFPGDRDSRLGFRVVMPINTSGN